MCDIALILLKYIQMEIGFGMISKQCFSKRKIYNVMSKITSNIEPASPPLSLCFLWITFKTFTCHIHTYSACMVTSGILFHG